MSMENKKFSSDVSFSSDEEFCGDWVKEPKIPEFSSDEEEMEFYERQSERRYGA